MLGEPERRAAVDAEGLERRTAAQERLVVGAEDRLVRVDEAAAADGEREQAHALAAASSGAPIAASSGRAFVHDSSISASGSESQTIAAADPEVDAARPRPRTSGS